MSLGLSVVSAVRTRGRLHSVDSTRSWVGVLDKPSAVGAGDGRAGVGSVVGWTEVLVVVVVDGERSGCNTSTGSAELGVLLGVLVLAAASAESRGVVVAWRWAVALLLLVVTDKNDLHESGDEEEDTADDGDGERSGVESASKAQVLACGIVVG